MLGRPELRIGARLLRPTCAATERSWKAAINQDGRALKYASADMQNDLVIVTEAVAGSLSALHCASDEVIKSGVEHYLDDLTTKKFYVLPETFICDDPLRAKRP